MNLNQVKLVAHRGASADYPENTLLAFEEACLAGVEGLELDLQLSGDGRLMVYHDEYYESMRFGGFKSDELRGEDMGRGERMPFLGEVLEAFSKNVTLYLEVKFYDYQQNSVYRWQVLEALKSELRERDDVSFAILSFDLIFLEIVAENCPSWPCVYNIEKGVGRIDFTGRYSFVYAICQELEDVSAEYSNSLKSHGVKSYCYGVNDDEALKKALDCGVDLIMTDRPDWLVGRIDQRSRVE